MKVVKEKFGNKNGKISKILEEIVHLYKDLKEIDLLDKFLEECKGRYGKINREELWK